MPEAARWRLRPAAAAAAALPRDLAGVLMQGPRRGEEGRGGAGRRELRGGKGRRGRSSGGTAAAATQPRWRERERRVGRRILPAEPSGDAAELWLAAWMATAVRKGARGVGWGGDGVCGMAVLNEGEGQWRPAMRRR